MTLVNLADVELRLIPGGCAADDKRPTASQTADALLPGGAQWIDDDIDAASIGLLQYPIGKGADSVVDGILCPMGDCLLALPFGASCGKNGRPSPASERQRRRTDSA